MRKPWGIAYRNARTENLDGFFAPREATGAKRARKMKVEHVQLPLRERRALQLDYAARLRKEILLLDNTSVRLIFGLYARDKYATTPKSDHE